MSNSYYLGICEVIMGCSSSYLLIEYEKSIIRTIKMIIDTYDHVDFGVQDHDEVVFQFRDYCRQSNIYRDINKRIKVQQFSNEDIFMEKYSDVKEYIDLILNNSDMKDEEIPTIYDFLRYMLYMHDYKNSNIKLFFGYMSIPYTYICACIIVNCHHYFNSNNELITQLVFDAKNYRNYKCEFNTNYLNMSDHKYNMLQLSYVEKDLIFKPAFDTNIDKNESPYLAPTQFATKLIKEYIYMFRACTCHEYNDIDYTCHNRIGDPQIYCNFCHYTIPEDHIRINHHEISGLVICNKIKCIQEYILNSI